MIIPITEDLAKEFMQNKYIAPYPTRDKDKYKTKDLYILKTRQGNYFIFSSLELSYREELSDRVKEIFENG